MLFSTLRESASTLSCSASRIDWGSEEEGALAVSLTPLGSLESGKEKVTDSKRLGFSSRGGASYTLGWGRLGGNKSLC